MKICRRARRWIELSFAGELPLDDEFQLEEHTRSCASCRARFDESREMLALLEELPAPPEERLHVERSLDAIHARLDAGAEPVTLLGSGARVWRAAAAAAALILATGGVLWTLRGTGSDEGGTVAEADLQPTRETEEDALAGLPDEALRPSPNIVERVPFPAWPTSELDDARLSETQVRVRERLLEAIGDSATTLDTDDRAGIDAFVARADELCAPLARLGWPVAQIAAGFVAERTENDPERTVARAALRYLGLRGRRLHLRTLEAALDDPTLARAALEAVADLGLVSPRATECRPACERLLAEAFWNPELSPAVHARIANLAAVEAEAPGAVNDSAGIDSAMIDWVALALDRAPHARGAAVAPGVEAIANGLPGLLAERGSAGARALLELAQHPLVRMDRALDAFVACAEAEEVLLEALGVRGRDGLAPATLLAAVELLRPDEAWSWLREQAWSGPERGRAAYVLAAYPGAWPVDALLELALTRRVEADDLLAAFRRAIEVEPPRMTELAIVIGERDDPRQSERYLEWLVLAHRPAGVPAVLALVERGDLGDQERERALLAAGEIGTANEAPLLAQLFARLGGTDRELAAAALLSLHRLGGAEAARTALDELAEETREEIVVLLADAARAGATSSTLYRLERALEPLLRARTSLSMRE